MQRFGLFVLSQEWFEFLVLFFSLVVFLFYGFYVFSYLFPVLFSSVFFEAFPDISLQCLLLCFFIFDRSSLFFHFLPESDKILVYLFDLLYSFPHSIIIRRHIIIKIFDAKLHFQLWIVCILMLFLDCPIHNLHSELVHLFDCDFLDSIFENLTIKLLIVYFGQIISLITCEIPISSLFNAPSYLRKQLFVSLRVAVIFENLD